MISCVKASEIKIDEMIKVSAVSTQLLFWVLSGIIYFVFKPLKHFYKMQALQVFTGIFIYVFDELL